MGNKYLVKLIDCDMREVVVEDSGNNIHFEVISKEFDYLKGQLIHKDRMVLVRKLNAADYKEDDIIANPSNDGSNQNTTHYNLPPGATELKHLIFYRNMNAQVGEIFRAAYRLGTASHSSKARDLRKIIAYAEQELERMSLYGE